MTDAMNTEPEALTVVKRLYQASETGDFATLTEVLAPNIEWKEMAGGPLSGTYRGVQEIMPGIFGRIDAAFAEFAIAPDEFVVQGNHVVMLGEYRAKKTAGSDPIAVRVVHFWTVEAGKITHLEQVTDPQALWREG
ncbi:MAG: nuclear transport factor 2 family protein [Renibacterium sp.]|nr:nuclear transport factor 2 family protein [Renibacterium sp.]